MNSKEYRKFLESYNGIYEQIGVKVPSGASDAEALKGLIPKGGKVHEVPKKKSILQNASYEPEGEMIGEHESVIETSEEVEIDLFDCILEHLVSEGYADTNEAALVIMTSMSENWKQSIVEGMGLSIGASKLAGRLLSNPRTSPEEGAKNFQKNLADPVGHAVKGAAKAVLGVGDEKNKQMMQKRRPN
jgi:hypothetical protein